MDKYIDIELCFGGTFPMGGITFIIILLFILLLLLLLLLLAYFSRRWPFVCTSICIGNLEKLLRIELARKLGMHVK